MTESRTPQVRTPPMGWNSWNAFSWNVTEGDVRDAADGLVETGLRDVGYEYLVVDDCWMAESLDEEGDFRANPETFPSGIADLADYVHERGLKFGIYSSAGSETCAGYPGSIGRERQHAEQFAEWGVDYLKYDNCGDHDGRDAIDRYAAMGEALASVDRDVVYSICEWGDNDPWLWGRNVGGHCWRTTGDILAKWRRSEDDEFGLGVVDIVDEMADPNLAIAHGPNGWNDPDMLQVGNGPDSAQSQSAGFTVDQPFLEVEQRTHFSFWCLFAAPLMAGTDLRTMDATTREMLTNEEAIAVDQDPLGLQGTRDQADGDRDVWSKRLADDDCAVILFNRGEDTLEIEADVETVDLAANVTADAERYVVRDLWSDEEWTTRGDLHATVDPHAVAFLRVGSE